MDLSPLQPPHETNSVVSHSHPVPLTILLAARNAAWHSLLDSEGLPWTSLKDLQETPGCYRIALVPQGASSEQVEQCNQVADHGGCVIFEDNLHANGVERQGTYALPFRASDFASVSESSDCEFVHVEHGRLGNGRYYRIPFELGRLWSATRVEKKHLVIDSLARSPVNHDLTGVVKKNIRAVVMDVLQKAFFRDGLPLVRKWYWPDGNRSVFCFRGDLDGGPKETLLRFVDATRSMTQSISLFVSGEKYAHRMDEIRALKDAGIEIGSHNYAHIVFPDRFSNARNVSRIHRLLESIGVHPTGHVSPASFWAPSQYRAIAERGYEYFSAFGLDHDNLPYYPCINNGLGTVLHIPYHCIGDFLPKFGIELDGEISIQTMISIMRLRYEMGAPVSVYGHPDVVGRIGDAPVLTQAIFDEAASYSDVWMCQLADLATWWRKRNEVEWNPYFCRQSHRLMLKNSVVCAGDNVAWNIGIHLPNGSWCLLNPASGSSTDFELREVPSLSALRQPKFNEIGEIVPHRGQPVSLRVSARRYKRETKRLLKKYYLLYLK